MTKALPGNLNKRRCKVCNNMAITGAPVCYWHGGAGIIARRRKAKKLKHGRWTDSVTDRARHAETLAERQAAEWGIPNSTDAPPAGSEGRPPSRNKGR